MDNLPLTKFTEHHLTATILCATISIPEVDNLPPEQVAGFLNQFFSYCESISKQLSLNYVKKNGNRDIVMVSGVDNASREDHAPRIAEVIDHVDSLTIS